MNDKRNALHRFLDMSPGSVHRRRMRVYMRKRRAMQTTVVKKKIKEESRKKIKEATDEPDVCHVAVKREDTASVFKTMEDHKRCSPLER